ncbi:MAG: DUF2442 domain-containing protein [Anaerolineaceae bacterium]|nr:DUF2442 domain-containing protein [Anaerolineaceae bacterium]
MCAYATTAENRTSLVEPPITPAMPWRVQQVDVLPDYRLFVRFLDGLEGYVNMKSFLFSDQAGVFNDLRDPDRFALAALVYGAVTWPGDLDLAPDAMYDQIKAVGEWNLD